MHLTLVLVPECHLSSGLTPRRLPLTLLNIYLGKGVCQPAMQPIQNYSLRVNSTSGEISFLSRSYDDTGWLKWTGNLPETMLETMYGNWHHLAFTHTWGNGSSTAVYFDGTDISSYGSWNELAPGISAGDYARHGNRRTPLAWCNSRRRYHYRFCRSNR